MDTESGIDLLYKAMDGNDISSTLTSALLEHIYTGKSLDCILGLKSTSPGSRHPRAILLLQLRGVALLAAWRHIKDKHKLSDRQASFHLFEILSGNESAEEIEDLINEIQLYSKCLKTKLGSAQVLYLAINDLLAAL